MVSRWVPVDITRPVLSITPDPDICPPNQDSRREEVTPIRAASKLNGLHQRLLIDYLRVDLGAVDRRCGKIWFSEMLSLASFLYTLDNVAGAATTRGDDSEDDSTSTIPREERPARRG